MKTSHPARVSTRAMAGTLLAGALALSACAPGSGQSSQPAGTSATPAAVETDIASKGKVELVVWDQEVRGSQNDSLVALNKEFEAKYPNVTIKRTSQANEDLQQQIALALGGNEVPDVIQVNNARGDMGQYVTAKQLVDLTPYAAAYKWEDRFPSSVLAKTRYSADGKTFGEGNLYALPQTGEVVGIFYSKSKLEKLGVSVPTTWEEYFAALDKAKAAGELPMVLGNLDKWPALHVFGPLQAHYVPVDKIVALGMGNAGATWKDDANTQAMTQFAKWGSEGYFGSSPNGTGYDAAWASFTKGTGVFLPGGSWLGTDMEAVMGDDLGFIAPPKGVDGKLATTGGTGIPFGIPARAKNVDVAAAYIDFITTEAAMKTIATNGGMPVLDTKELAPATGVQHDIFTAFATVSEEGTLLPYLDYATPTFADTAGQGLQEVLGGQRTPEQVLEAFENDYAAFTG